VTTHLAHRIGLLSATALFVVCVGHGVPAALAAGNDIPEIRNPGPINQAPADSSSTKRKTPAQKETDRKKAKDDKKSELDFIEGYKAARQLILASNYQGGIAAMHALGHDDNPDVANYIGYSYRRMGDYDQSKVWYEKALAANPDHTRTWSYYGMWQMEQGNRLKAKDDLQKVKLLCGNTDCREYTELKAVIDGTGTY
jgi:tetratricopeptide (TPR) repeat protein